MHVIPSTAALQKKRERERAIESSTSLSLSPCVGEDLSPFFIVHPHHHQHHHHHFFSPSLSLSSFLSLGTDFDSTRVTLSLLLVQVTGEIILHKRKGAHLPSIYTRENNCNPSVTCHPSFHRHRERLCCIGLAIAGCTIYVSNISNANHCLPAPSSCNKRHFQLFDVCFCVFFYICLCVYH